jgi:hypothetical protein
MDLKREEHEGSWLDDLLRSGSTADELTRAFVNFLNTLRKPISEGSQLSETEQEYINLAGEVFLELIDSALNGDPSYLNRLMLLNIKALDGESGDPTLFMIDPTLPSNKKIFIPKLFKGLRSQEPLPPWKYVFMILKRLHYFLSLLPGGIPWEKIKRCFRCQDFFLKKRRQKYCSPKCRDANPEWQPDEKSEKRRQYRRVRAKFERLVNEKGLGADRAWEDLLQDPRYSWAIKKYIFSHKEWNALK